MKKLLLITENLGSGGAERQLAGLAVMLKEKGYEIKFVTYVEKQFYLQYLLSNNIDYKLLLKAKNRYLRIFYLYKELSEFKPDTVISYLPSANIAMCITKLLYRTRLIISERSHTQCFNLKTKLKFFIYNNADILVANSSSESENIKMHFPKLINKTYAVHNFIDTERFKPEFPRNINSKPLIYCVGRVIASKNVLNLLKAMRIAIDKGFDFNVLWRGSKYDTGYCNKVMLMVQELGLNGNFILKDQSNNLLKEYQSADIFCLPSLYEGYPNVICEAMSCGLPVICSNICENPSIVENKVNGFLFQPEDPDDIANSIIQVLSMSYGDRAKMGRQNRKKIIVNNSMDTFIENYIRLI